MGLLPGSTSRQHGSVYKYILPRTKGQWKKWELERRNKIKRFLWSYIFLSSYLYFACETQERPLSFVMSLFGL